MPTTTPNSQSDVDVPSREPAKFHEKSENVVPMGDRVRLFSPHLATLIGLNEAIILNQIHYWIRRSTKEHKGRHWVKKSYREWVKEFPCWSESTIKRAIETLERPSPGGKTGVKRGRLLVACQPNNWKYDRTKWYRIDYDEYNKLLTEHPARGHVQENDPTDEVNLSQSRDTQCSDLDEAKVVSSYNKSTK